MGVQAILLVRLPAPLDDEELTDLAYALAEAFGDDPLDTRPSGPPDGRSPVLEVLDVSVWASYYGIPAESSHWLRLRIGRSYYGPGYERGPVVDYLAIARWWEYRVPGVVVWYGGDEDGYPIRPLDETERHRLFEHFCRVGHRPYETPNWKHRVAPGAVWPRCCGRPMTWVGWHGRAIHVLRCLACRREEEFPNNGTLIIENGE